jgi:hypothetical protein
MTWVLLEAGLRNCFCDASVAVGFLDQTIMVDIMAVMRSGTNDWIAASRVHIQVESNHQDQRIEIANSLAKRDTADRCEHQ